MEKTKHITKE